MHQLLTTLNVFNGNIFFVGATEVAAFLFEYDLVEKNLTTKQTSGIISDTALIDESSYLVATSSKWIRIFNNGVYDDFINASPYRIDKIEKNMDSGSYYMLDRSVNMLVKVDGLSPFNVVWAYVLPDEEYKENGEIKARTTDSSIIFSNDKNVHVIRDYGDTAALTGTVNLTEGDIRVVTSGEFNPHHAHLRWKTLIGSELDVSSSSSSSSESSDSSSSSSSLGYSSSSSSWGYSSSSSSSSYNDDNMVREDGQNAVWEDGVNAVWE